MKKIIMIVGARPNYMKAYPIYKQLINHYDVILIHTGQHFDEKMKDLFFNQLNFPQPNIQFNLTSTTRAGKLDNMLYINNNSWNKEIIINKLFNDNALELGQLGEIRDKLIFEFNKIKPNLVMVFGDVTSTLAGAIATKKLNIKLAHVESGLRSFDLSMPEEVNRILVDMLSDYYFITEPSGIINLQNENITENLYLVGNTMIDCLMMFINKTIKPNYLNVKPKEYVLITLHRPSNVDDPIKFNKICQDIITLSQTEQIIFPIHPRTKNNLKHNMSNVILCEPLGYLEFTYLEANAKYVITDSGGVQEETTMLNVPCFTLRENTERPITLIENGGTNQLINNICDIKLVDCENKVSIWNGASAMNILNICKKMNI